MSVKKFLIFSFVFSLSVFSASSQKKTTQSKNAAKSVPAKSTTTTKTPEAKKAVDKLKKNPNPKKAEPVVVFNEDFEKGEELFQLNRPAKAIEFFEKSLEAENVDPKVYVYLGVCYYQIEQYDKSLAVCVQGLAKEGTDHKILAYNAGNSCYAMGNYMRADASYAIALREDESYSPAVLNRANAQLKLDHLGDARENYIKYLEMEPNTPQRERIEEIIRLLGEEIERRANEKPELINPDLFVENEKMEIPDPPERVYEELPAEQKPPATPKELVRDDAVAPKIAEEPKEKIEETKISGEDVPSIPVSEKLANEKVENEFIKEKTPVVIPVPIEIVGSDSIAPEIPPEQLRLAQKVTKEGLGSGVVEKVGVDDEIRRFEEERRQLEAEKRRLEEEKRVAEEARIAAEEERQRLAEEEEARIAEEKRALEEELRNLEKAKLEAEIEAQKKALEEAAAQQRAEEERKAAEEKRKAEVASWPKARAELAIEGAKNFTPDGDGLNDSIVLLPKVMYLEEPADIWELKIFDPKGNLFRTMRGKGNPPERIEWDGTSESGELVLSKNSYTATLSVTPSATDKKRLGTDTLSASEKIDTGLLLQVIIPGKEWKMVINTINFDPDAATSKKLTKEQIVSNYETLNEVAEQIKEHPGVNIVIVEGYANNISGTEKENREELLPLSQKRAEAIVEELVKRGVSRDILSAKGMGGANPMADRNDTANWYKNRRVEFMLKK